jgi:tetratricopeptide (TPR) repeat protein
MAHQNFLKPRFGAETRAIIVDGYPTARSLLASHLRSLGVEQITQCGRASEARANMAARGYDVLVCEHRLACGTLGQDLIDELRRSEVLSLATVVLMVSSEATYRVVAQVAESALDGFIIKPFSVGDLEDRILRAFVRKESLKHILDALDERRYADALALCETRFKQRGPHWTSAARLGAELAMRENRMPLASAMFDAVIQDKAVPWAKLGIARVLEASDQKGEALSTIERLLASEPNYADAYDVMGRLHTEQGNFGAAINAYKQASTITPNSVLRAQKYGILAHYAGQQDEAVLALERAVAVGLESPYFDHQALVALAVCRYRRADVEGLKRCREMIDAANGNQPAMPTEGLAPNDRFRRDRLLRMGRLVAAFDRLLDGNTESAIHDVEALAASLLSPEFDVEAATNLLSLLSAAVAAGGVVPQAEEWVRATGRRFCVSRHATELLARACEGVPVFADLLRGAHAEISEASRSALSEGLSGRHGQAVEKLLDWIGRTLNGKLLEVAEATIARYEEKLHDVEGLRARCEDLKRRCGRAVKQRLLAEAHDTAPSAAWVA